MLLIKNFSRIVPRSVSRIAIPRSIGRKNAPLLHSSWNNTRAPVKLFSTYRARRADGKDGDSELIAKITSELQFENDVKEEITLSTCIKDFLDNSPFDIIDQPGKEEVVLTRNYGQEKIQIAFSISDINMDPDSDMPEQTFGDEEGEGSQEAQKNHEDGNQEGNEEDGSGDLPIRLHIVIEKAEKGALVMDSSIQDGVVMIDSCFYYKNPEHAHAKTPQLFHERQDMYAGPPFGNLDESLQILFERYLDERGINTTLATFVPEYIAMKEQKEYVRWLEDVRKFVKS